MEPRSRGRRKAMAVTPGSALRCVLLVAVATLGGPALVQAAPAKTCVSTSANRPNESQNPNYRPGAPVRSFVGRGHVLTGVVRSSATCRPIARAKLEFFQTTAHGRYSNGVTSWAGRATLFSRATGGYRFEGPFPGGYGGNNPHIHVHVTAAGYRPLFTTYFPGAGETRAHLDLVLVPEPSA